MSTTKDIAIQLSLAIASGDWARAEALLADDFQYVGDGRPALDKAQYLHFMRHVLCSGMAHIPRRGRHGPPRRGQRTPHPRGAGGAGRARVADHQRRGAHGPALRADAAAEWRRSCVRSRRSW